MTLKTSLQLILGNSDPTSDEVAMKEIDFANIKPKETELKRFMDPGNLAE